MKKSISLLIVCMLVLSHFMVFGDTYTVKSGDTLYSIAKTHGICLRAIIHENNIANPHLIFPGEVFTLPEEKSKQSSPTDSNANKLTGITANIKLLHTNDMHGFFIEGKYDGMGAAKVAAVVNQQKAENPNTLVLDAGDALQGHNLVTVSDGETGTGVMNAIGYDAMVAGNHEFDYGSEQTLKLKDMLNFPMLGANVALEDGTPFLEAYKMFEVGGIKVGVFGLATPETTYKSHPDNTKGIIFKSIIDTANQMVTKLKSEGADVIVCLGHLGDEGDYSSLSVAKAVPEIDVIIDGHSHSTYEKGRLVNGVLIGSTGAKTKNVGIIDISIQNGEITSKSASLFTKKMAENITPVAEVETIVNNIEAANAPILNKVIANTPIQLDGEKEQVRKGQTNLGNIIVESLLDISGADLAFTNGGGIRSSLPAGDITVGNVLTVLPFGNTVRVIELKGSDFKAALENGLSEYPEANGGFPHFAGAAVTFDAKKPAGERVVEVTVSGKPLDLEKTYTLATNDFLVAGGDDYSMFKDKKVVAEFGAMDEVLIDYVNKNGFDKAIVDDRLKEISELAKAILEWFAA